MWRISAMIFGLCSLPALSFAGSAVGSTRNMTNSNASTRTSSTTPHSSLRMM